jgi:DNA-binding transcriptional ArsR family regulator
MSRHVKRPSLADTIIHPQRLELLTVLQTSGPLSAHELLERVPGLSQASLYRHLKTLRDAGIIVAAERHRDGPGAPEKTFSVAATAPSNIRLRGRERSRDALRRYLLAMQAAELTQLEKIIAAGPIEKRHLYLRQSIVYLNRDELREVEAMLARLKELETRGPAARRAFALNLRLFPAR